MAPRLRGLVGLVGVLLAGALVLAPVPALSAGPVGAVITTITPVDSGNGRAVAHDPRTGRLFYTNAGDPHIYVARPDGSWVATLTPRETPLSSPVVYAALTFQPTSSGGVLWGGRYDGSGQVDRINPVTGRVSPAFTVAFPVGGSCYSQPPGYVDGLAFDQTDNTLWVGDDNARSLLHVRMSGSIIGQFAVPAGRCRTGIADDGAFLWLGLQSGPDTPPYDIVRVAKSDPTTVLQDFPFFGPDGPEGLAMDASTFPGTCALWSNGFGEATVLRAWRLPAGLCQQLPHPAGLPTPSIRSVGLLTFTYPDANGRPTVAGCVATVVDSENLSTIVTAAHCLSDNGSFPGAHQNLQFAPAHTGACWLLPNNPSGSPQIPVSLCGGNPYGVWTAGPSDIHLDPSFNPNDQAANGNDFAFITMHPPAGGQPVQARVGGFPITWDFSTDPATDPLQKQTWIVTSYASDAPDFTSSYGFGPWQCRWTPTPPNLFFATGTSSTRLTGLIGEPCAFVNPMTGALSGFLYLGGAFGDSGSPWTNTANTPDGRVSIGAIHKGDALNPDKCGIPSASCLLYAQGAKLNYEAQLLLNSAETSSP